MQVQYPVYGGQPIIPAEQLNRVYDDEEDYDEDEWQYSKFALPWLTFCGVLLALTFMLTFWQQTGNIKDQWDGVPRKLVTEALADGDTEGGMPKDLRNVRIGIFFFGSLALAGAFLLYFARAGPKMRMTFGVIIVPLLLLITGIIAFISFGVGLDKYDRAVQCPEHRSWTGEQCESRKAYAVAAVGVDAVTGIVALFAALQVAYNSKRGHWRMAPRGYDQIQRDFNNEKLRERKQGQVMQQNVGYVRRWLTGINLVGLAILLLATLILLVTLHEDREVQYVRSYRGRAYSDLNPGAPMPYEHAGWPTRNTRLRYAAAAIGLLTLVFNFMPFRSKALAIVFAFFYGVSAFLLIIACGFDFYELREADKLPCPWTPAGEKMECTKSPFLATAFFDFFTGLCLLLYILLEYIMGGSRNMQEERRDRRDVRIVRK